MKEAWIQVEPTKYVDGWHIELICKALEYAYYGKLPDNNLYINIPPVHMKTLLCAIFFPAWVWAKDASKRFICISYSEKLENKSSRKCRQLIESDWYKSNFNVHLSEDNNQISEYANTEGGIRYSVGITGTITGRHADFIIMDDLLSASDTASNTELENVNSIYDDVIPSRLADPKKAVKIILCQRLSTKDIIGHIDSKKEKYERIILPEEYEGVRYISSFSELQDPRKEEGELIWPERMGLREVMDRKQNMSILGYSGQYQQRPSPISGHIFQREWFKNRILNDEIVGRIISADTSFGNTGKSDFTSIIVGEFRLDYSIFIRDIFRARLEYPQLIEEIEKMALRYKYKLKKIIIESKASGISVIQSLNQSSTIIHRLEDELGLLRNTLVSGINPTKDKIVRASLVSQWCEKGMVYLPQPSNAFPWLFDFEEELFLFPNGANDDQVDAFTQLLHFSSAKLATGLQSRNL